MKNGKHLTMGIETSCDETAVAVLADGREILSNIISSQIEVHRVYGGVVPEIASRHHLNNIPFVYEKALLDAGVTIEDIDEIGVTAGPGLAGALLMGTAFAKAVAYAANKPLVGVHHTAGHIMAATLEHPKLKPPFLSMVVSGGHTSIVEVKGYNEFVSLGETRDDAAGEACDKVARLLGLSYPGGPEIDKLSKKGNPHAIELRRVYLEPGSLDFSFSGTKTGVINYLHNMEQKGLAVNKADVAASFLKTVVDVLVHKAMLASEKTGYKSLALAGGVASNTLLRAELKKAAEAKGIALFIPSPLLCTDNGAMIAAAAYHKAAAGLFSGLTLDVYPGLEMGDGTEKLSGKDFDMSSVGIFKEEKNVRI